jgi:hypothetical protein
VGVGLTVLKTGTIQKLEYMPRSLHLVTDTRGAQFLANVGLLLALMSESQSLPRPFADRLIERNKSGKHIISAVARKLIELAKLILARKSEWVPR